MVSLSVLNKFQNHVFIRSGVHGPKPIDPVLEPARARISELWNLRSNRTVGGSRYQVVPHGDRSIPKEFQMHIQASTCNKVVKVNSCRPIKIVYRFFTWLTDYTQSSRRFTLKSLRIYCVLTVTVNLDCQILDNSSKYFSKMLVFQVDIDINFWETDPLFFRNFIFPVLSKTDFRKIHPWFHNLFSFLMENSSIFRKDEFPRNQSWYCPRNSPIMVKWKKRRISSKFQNDDDILKIYDLYERKSSYLLVMEKPPNCIDLFEYSRKNGALDEKMAKKIFYQVVEACIDMQKKEVLHRDIKDENILLNEKTNQVNKLLRNWQNNDVIASWNNNLIMTHN